MNITGILIACLVVGGAGIVIGVLLGIAGKKFAVEVDEKAVAIREALPGSNCGGCGYAGCDALAQAIADGTAPANSCPVGGAAVAAKMAEILGVEVETVRKTAFIKCAGDCEKAGNKYEYTGNMSCKEASYVSGGPKQCQYGCMGYGSCVAACPFDAIHVENGVAVVDKEKCKACGKCVEVCPKHLISLRPYSNTVQVACSSTDKGPVTMKACKTGCVGCGICVKNCQHDAVKVENFHAIIDPEKCVGCGACMEKCPKKCIVKA